MCPGQAEPTSCYAVGHRVVTTTSDGPGRRMDDGSTDDEPPTVHREFESHRSTKTTDLQAFWS